MLIYIIIILNSNPIDEGTVSSFTAELNVTTRGQHQSVMKSVGKNLLIVTLWGTHLMDSWT